MIKMSKELEALNRIENKAFSSNLGLEILDDITMLRKALKRNEPMKPIIADEYSDPECPSCFEELNWYYCESKSKHTGDNYCPNCGQKLDWSDDDGK